MKGYLLLKEQIKAEKEPQVNKTLPLQIIVFPYIFSQWSKTFVRAMSKSMM
jgi:hypothetical protein